MSMTFKSFGHMFNLVKAWATAHTLAKFEQISITFLKFWFLTFPEFFEKAFHFS